MITQTLGVLVCRLRTVFWTLFYRCVGRVFLGSIGRGCIFEGWIDIPQFGGKISLGEHVRVCRLVELSATRGAVIKIGNRTFLGRGVLINSQNSVTLGESVLIAEGVSIHDSDHSFQDTSRRHSQGSMISRTVTIGDNVWIGAKSCVLSGSNIPNNCVLGAMSVTTRHSKLRSGCVLAGAPVRIIRE